MTSTLASRLASRPAWAAAFVFAAATLAAAHAQAQPCSTCGRVESVHRVQNQGSTSGVGAVAGGVVGGVVGNQVGNGRGRTLATVAGAAGGAVAGKRGRTQPQHQLGLPGQRADGGRIDAHDREPFAAARGAIGLGARQQPADPALNGRA